MRIDPGTGTLPAASTLVNVPLLITAYYTQRPDVSVSAQRVAFGTAGHWGSALGVSFNEPHILVITQAIYDYRRQHAITGPLFLGADIHIVTRDAGLVNPNRYLAAAIVSLFTHRPKWPPKAGIGKTVVSSSMIDRIAAWLGRPLCRPPVGNGRRLQGLRRKLQGERPPGPHPGGGTGDHTARVERRRHGADSGRLATAEPSSHDRR